MEEGEDCAMSVGGSPTKTPSKASTYRFREFFVNWVGKSHWKNSWISEIRVSSYVHVCLKSICVHLVLSFCICILVIL